MHEAGRIDTIEHLWRRSGVRVDTLRRMASADAFGSMGITKVRISHFHDGVSELTYPTTAFVSLTVNLFTVSQR